LNPGKLVIFVVGLLLVVSLTCSSFFTYTAFAAPPSWGFNTSNNCTTDQSNTLSQKTCCWTENVEPGTGNPDLGGNQEKYCQTCSQVYQDGQWVYDCDEPELQFRTAPTTEESIFPNDDSKVLDEQQPNPTSPLTDQRVPPGNVGILEQLEDSSNDEQSQESKELTETNNVETASNSQENDETSNSETTTSLSKKGNTQNSPVPPECPKQGPIPPDCTMKPKF
jgi:hypothetical protein